MKSQSLRDEPISRPQFLEKFAGKLNIMTKHGEIKDEQQFKLPLIKNTTSQRSNTHIFTQSKQSLLRKSSEYDRNFMSRSAASHNRVNKTTTEQLKLAEIQKFFKKDANKQNIKLSRIRAAHVEPFSAVPLTKKTTVSLTDQWDPSIVPQIRPNKKEASDYSDFLSELDKVSSMIKTKKLRG